jgi:RHS repeat-associated protein
VVQQQDDYYPFGLEINRSVLSPKNEYLYNKKELQEEFQEYDYGARFYDPVIARWNTIDPLAEKSRRWSPYNYVENNPIRLTDLDGMAAVDPIYDLHGKNIGDDGKNDGKKQIVTDNKQAKEIEKKGGITDLKNVAHITLNGGRTTIEGVKNSVNAEQRDSAPNANDAGLHEEGGDTRTDFDGNVEAVAWAPGPKINPDGTGGTIQMFNGVDTPAPYESLDSWHVHTSVTQEVPDEDGGGGSTNRGSMTPSGDPTGTHGGGDYGVARSMQKEGYQNTTIQVGTSKGITVNFYNGSGIVGSMSYKAFLKMGDN